MSLEAVKEYFKTVGKEQDVMETETSSATVELAAQALGVEPARIAKSLTFKDKDGGCILIVTAGDAKIHSGQFKRRFGCKSSMLTPEEVEAFTGHAIGGVCPFAITREDVAVYLDISLQRFTTVFPACGSSNSMIELTCEELYRYANAKEWVDVSKGWQESNESLNT